MLCTGKSFTNFSSCKTQDFLVGSSHIIHCLFYCDLHYLPIHIKMLLKVCFIRINRQNTAAQKVSLLNLNDSINYYAHLVKATGKIMSIKDTICQLNA